eukprot:7030502-Prorocentrum_lima.AAC.1
MSCFGSASMHIPNMVVLHKSFQQPTNSVCASLGCFVWTLAAIATTHAMSGLVFCACLLYTSPSPRDSTSS